MLTPPDELQVARRAVVPPGEGDRSGLGRLTGLGRRAGAAAFGRDSLVLGALLLLAATVRFAGLPGRGDFDGDQGHDMLTLLLLVRDGQIPLLGPPTSIGDFHHGAAYYSLLAPVAWLSGADPVAVLGMIAALGTAAVGVTWWFARAIGGRVAGAIAGLLLAISPAAIEESTFLWNPNPIPFFAALALAAAWRGRRTGRARWWVLAVASAGMVAQLHVLGIVFLPPIFSLGVAEIVAARRPGGEPRRARRTSLGLGAGLGIVALLYMPLLIHELQTGWEETRNVAAFLGAAGSADDLGALDPFERLMFTAFRIVGWPFVGQVTAAPFGAIATVGSAVGLGLWLTVRGHGDGRSAARWLGLTVAWSAVALTVLAPSLQAVVPGLPNDHYHSFLDPVVVVVVALGLAALASAPGAEGVRDAPDPPSSGPSPDRGARVVVAGAVVAVVVLGISRWAPLTQPNGGWPFARDAGIRIVALSPDATFDVRGLPIFKTAEGIGYPVVAAGGTATIATDVASAGAPLAVGATLVIVCDRLFERVIGDPCGGPAEDHFIGRLLDGQPGSGPRLVDRFDASPRTSVSVYRP